jgi:hypothetical protein
MYGPLGFWVKEMNLICQVENFLLLHVTAADVTNKTDFQFLGEP